jgi:hypothetical protein
LSVTNAIAQSKKLRVIGGVKIKVSNFFLITIKTLLSLITFEKWLKNGVGLQYLKSQNINNQLLLVSC